MKVMFRELLDLSLYIDQVVHKLISQNKNKNNSWKNLEVCQISARFFKYIWVSQKLLDNWLISIFPLFQAK